MVNLIKDNSLKKVKFTSDNETYNLEKKLLKEKIIDNNFINKLQFIKLEELITLKLISSTRDLNGKLYNFPILKYAFDICKESIIKYALSVSNNRREASLILGMKKAEIIDYINRHDLKEEFKL